MSHSRGGHPHTAQKPEVLEHGEEAVPNAVNEWSSRIHFKKHELGGGFAVLIFLGEVSEDPERWRTSRSFVGAHHAYVSAASQYGGGQASAVSEGFVQLNAAIAERSGLTSYEPDEVVPYLKDNLDWRIQAADRSAVEPGRLPSVEVAVVSNLLTYDPNFLFPIVGKQQYHHDITYGRPGGARCQLKAQQV